MRFVLDASIAITWAMRDEQHPLADLAFIRVQSDRAIVPAIWWYELRNILVSNEKRGRISLSDCGRFLASLEQLGIDVVAPDHSDHVMDIARKHKLSVYDAAYLSLAVRDRLPLATLDKALAAASLAEGVPTLNSAG